MVGVIFAATMILYAPSLGYPFVWYDSDDLLRAIKYSTADLFGGVAGYQYYRPLIFTFWKLILAAWGPESAPIFHAYLIGLHALNAVLLFALTRDLTRNRWVASTASLLFVVYPFSYQAVTWTIAHQPPSLSFALGCLLIYTRARIQRTVVGRDARRPFLVSRVACHLAALLCLLAAMVIHESAFVGAGLVVLVEVHLVLTRRVARWTLWPLVYAALTVVTFGAYVLAAKSPPAEETFQIVAGLYLLQGLIYPIAMLIAPACAAPGCDPSFALLAGTGLALVAMILAWRAGRSMWLGLLGVLWFGLGAAPVWIGRNYIYVEYAPRLFYLSSAGVALAFAALLGNPPRRRLAWIGLIGFVALQSSQFVLARQPLYADAFRLLDQENRAMFTPRRGAVLFINAVELFTYQPRELPLGWFGVLASPWHNRMVETLTLRAQNADWVIDPVHAQAVQSRSRLLLEFHGRVLPPDQLAGAIAAAREIYRVDAIILPPHPTSRSALRLFKIAEVDRQTEPVDTIMAGWPDGPQLNNVSIEMEAGTPVLNLDWYIGAPAPHGLTVFVHIRNASGEIVAQADGDPVGGLAPFSSWVMGDQIRERRPLILPFDLPAGTYQVAVGLYDRNTGRRASPTRTRGVVIDAGALIVGGFAYPDLMEIVP